MLLDDWQVPCEEPEPAALEQRWAMLKAYIEANVMSAFPEASSVQVTHQRGSEPVAQNLPRVRGVGGSFGALTVYPRGLDSPPPPGVPYEAEAYTAHPDPNGANAALVDRELAAHAQRSGWREWAYASGTPGHRWEPSLSGTHRALLKVER